MKSLEDLESAFERGLNAWETEIVIKHAGKMGKKCVREVKRNTPVDSGTLRRRWNSSVGKEGRDVVITIENDVEYAPYVNEGHRIVKNEKTVGYKEGHHMLEKGIAAYRGSYMSDDLQEMVTELGKGLRG